MFKPNAVRPIFMVRMCRQKMFAPLSDNPWIGSDRQREKSTDSVLLHRFQSKDATQKFDIVCS